MRELHGIEVPDWYSHDIRPGSSQTNYLASDGGNPPKKPQPPDLDALVNDRDEKPDEQNMTLGELVERYGPDSKIYTDWDEYDGSTFEIEIYREPTDEERAARQAWYENKMSEYETALAEFEAKQAEWDRLHPLVEEAYQKKQEQLRRESTQKRHEEQRDLLRILMQKHPDVVEDELKGR